MNFFLSGLIKENKKMGKKDKNKKKGKGAEKTAMKTDKKLLTKQKKLLEKIGEVRIDSPLNEDNTTIFYVSTNITDFTRLF